MTTTPVFVDAVGPTPGTNLNAADLNVFVQAITYRLSGGIASSASGLTVTQPACQAVISAAGTAPVYLSVSATTVPLSAGPVVSQDQYVYLLNNGTYQVVSVNHGGSPTPPVTANIPLYYATTNGGNTAVTSYTDVSNTNPIGSQGSFMNTTGTNAGGVAFPSTLTVAGLSTLNGNLAANGTASVAGLATLTGGATMGADIAMANKLLKNAGAVGVGTSSPVGPVHVAVAPSGSANFGVISVGSGAFDGSSGGHFVGTGAGTLIAGNTAAGFAGNLLDLQNGGVFKFRVASDGTTTAVGALIANSITASAGVNSFAGTTTFSGHLLTSGSTPSLSNKALSTSGVNYTWSASTVTASGNDQAGMITTGGASLSISGATNDGFFRLCTVTFAGGYGAAPQIFLSLYQSDSCVNVKAINISASGFDIIVGISAASGGIGIGLGTIGYFIIG